MRKFTIYLLLLIYVISVRAQGYAIYEGPLQRQGDRNVPLHFRPGQNNENQSSRTAQKQKGKLSKSVSPNPSGNLMNMQFDTFLPLGWTVAPEVSLWMEPVEAFGYVPSTPRLKKNGDVGYAIFNAFIGAVYDPFYLITPSLAPTTKNHVLSYEVTEFLISPKYMSKGMELYVEVSADDGMTWIESKTNILEQIPGHNTPEADNLSVVFTLDLKEYIDRIIKIRFKGISDFGAFMLALDDIKGVPYHMPSEVDLSVSEVSYEPFYSIIPLLQSTEILPSAIVSNLGADLTTPTNLNFNVTPGGYSRNISINSMPIYDSQKFSLNKGNGFTPQVVGTYTIKAGADISDPTPENNTASNTFIISDNTFATDNGNFAGGYGVNYGTIIFGNLYEFERADAIASFSIAFETVESMEFRVRIYSVDNGLEVATLIYESEVFDRADALVQHQFKEFRIERQPLQPGKYLFCIDQFGEEKIDCAYDGEENGIYYVVDRQTNRIFPYANSEYGNFAIRINTTPVYSLTPPKGHNEVCIDTPIQVTFTQNMSEGTLTDISIQPDPGNISATITDNVLAITHDPFAYNTDYTITVPATAVNGLVEDIIWSFTTDLDPADYNTPDNLSAIPDKYSAILSWRERGAGEAWDIKYGPMGFDFSTEGTLIDNITSNPFLLEGLDHFTSYDFYVRAKCSATEFSDWSQLYTFRTEIDCGQAISTFPWIEDFENSQFPPVCWTAYDVDGDGVTWENNPGPFYVRSGENSAFHNFNYLIDNEGWLVTPKIAIPLTDNYILRFWSINTLVSNYVKNSVLISTGSGDPADGDFVEVWSPATVSSDWEETKILLSKDYAGREIYIAFKYESHEFSHIWYLDDISISDFNIVDAEIKSIVAPSNNANLTDAEEVTVLISNNGSETISNFELKLTVNDTEVATEIYKNSIPTLGQANYTFKAKVDLSAVGFHTIKVSVNLENDEEPSNDEFIKEIENYGKYAVMGTHTLVKDCDIKFIDDGLFEWYIKEKDVVQTITFMPEDAGGRIIAEFSVLNVAEGYSYGDQTYEGDTLFVYEGTTPDKKNRIAYFTGYYFNDDLPSLISYAPDGALTFEFKKSCDCSMPGWEATIKCIKSADRDLAVKYVEPLRVVPDLPVTPKVTIWNLGRKVEDAWTVELTNGKNYRSVVNGTTPLKVGDEIVVEMDQWIPTKGENSLTATVRMSGDGNPDNDTMTIEVFNEYYGEAYVYNVFVNHMYFSLDLLSEDVEAIGKSGYNEYVFPLGEEFNGKYIYRLYNDLSIGIVYPDGVYEPLGTVAGLNWGKTGFISSGLTYDWKNKKWYILANYSDDDQNIYPQVYELNMTTFVATLVGQGTEVEALRGLEMADDGYLYSVSLLVPSLVKIDPVKWKFEVVGPTGLFNKYGQDLSFDEKSRKLYSMASFVNGWDEYCMLGYYDLQTGAFNATSDYSPLHFPIICITNEPDPVGIESEFIRAYNSKVYPNPSHGPVHIEVTKDASVKIIDILGTTIEVMDVLADTVVTVNLPVGIYIVNIDVDGRTTSHKVVVN